MIDGDLFTGLQLPPSAELLGWRLIDARAQEGWVRIGYEGRSSFVNPAGYVQGGMLAAMIDDAIGPAVFAHSRGETYIATIDLHVSYLAPARPGPLFVEARVVQAGRTIGFVEAHLEDADGTPLVRAAASVRLVPASAVQPPSA